MLERLPGHTVQPLKRETPKPGSCSQVFPKGYWKSEGRSEVPCGWRNNSKSKGADTVHLTLLHGGGNKVIVKTRSGGPEGGAGGDIRESLIKEYKLSAIR